MTDQTKHDIGGLQTENKAKRHEREKLQNEMDDAMESLSIIGETARTGISVSSRKVLILLIESIGSILK